MLSTFPISNDDNDAIRLLLNAVSKGRNGDQGGSRAHLCHEGRHPSQQVTPSS